MTQPVFSDKLKKRLEDQQYRIVGNHSAVKICGWTKNAITDKGFCYKQKFYGIKSHQCVQMSTYLTCANFCTFCWRDMTAPAHTEFKGEPDDPKEILDGCIEAQKKLLIGFKGNDQSNKQLYQESDHPTNIAISLTGEPILYPKLQEMIEYANTKNMNTFVVCSGQFPEQMSKLTPTQLYLSLDAPNEELLKKIDKSIHKDSWERMLKSLDEINKANQRTRTAIRITCVKKMNMVEPENYAQLIEKANPLFVEVKGYSFVGSSRQRLSLENMPTNEEVKLFAEDIAKHCNYQIIEVYSPSRVVLLMKEEDRGKRFLK